MKSKHGCHLTYSNSTEIKHSSWLWAPESDSSRLKIFSLTWTPRFAIWVLFWTLRSSYLSPQQLFYTFRFWPLLIDSVADSPPCLCLHLDYYNEVLLVISSSSMSRTSNSRWPLGTYHPHLQSSTSKSVNALAPRYLLGKTCYSMLLSRGPTFCPSQEKGHLSPYILNDVNGSVKYGTGMYGWVYAQKQNQSVGLKMEKNNKILC